MKSFKILALLAIAIFTMSSSFGQKLESGNLIGLHSYDITLNENVTPEQFETFYLENYIPAFEKSMSGVKIKLLKGERGEHKGKYGGLIYFKSLKDRDYWIPEPSKMSEEGKKAMEKLQPMIDKLQEMVTFESKFTDWIIL